MAHAEGTITINRPVDVVYDFLLDGMNNPLWRSGVVDIQQLPGKPSGVGAVFKQRLKGPGGGRIDGDYEIVELKPNLLIKFQVIAGPARPEGTYQFESLGQVTRLTFILHFEPKGVARLMDGVIQKTMLSEVAALEHLKKVIESR